MHRFLIGILFLALAFVNQSFAQTGIEGDYKFKFTIKGSDDSLVYMANYYGKKQYYKDTAYAESPGVFVFQGKKKLYEGGIYMIVMPDRTAYFEFIMADKQIEMVTERNNLVNAMQVKKSDENKLFYEYLKTLDQKSKDAKPWKEMLGNVKNSEDSTKMIKDKLKQIDEEVQSYRENFISDNSTTLVAKIFNASIDPEVPEDLEIPEGKEADEVKFKYYRKHYLDNIDFKEERLIRTPIYHNKLEYYIKKLTPQTPDSIIASADRVIAKTKGTDELFKYTVHYITNTYERSKIMGMDAVFVHMAEKYYMSGEAFWLDEKKLKKISDRANTLKPLLLNKVAPNIILPDTSGKWHNLHAINAKYTVLYFWDSGCGHCKKATPKLKDMYADMKAKYDMEVFAVGTELEVKDWKKYIRNNELPWINISDTPEINKNAYDYIGKQTTLNSLNFRDIYDIYSTPVVYLLDKDKKILGKRLSIEQLEEFILELEKENTEEDKG